MWASSRPSATRSPWPTSSPWSRRARSTSVRSRSRPTAWGKRAAPRWLVSSRRARDFPASRHASATSAYNMGRENVWSAPAYKRDQRDGVTVCADVRARFGEALRLRVGDVDLAGRHFVVRENKGKTRLVPFRADLAHVLRRYVAPGGLSRAPAPRSGCCSSRAGGPIARYGLGDGPPPLAGRG